MTETQLIIEQLGSLSYIGIFVTAFLANVAIPVPEEIVIIAFGYLLVAGKLNVFILVPIVVLGLLLSDIAMYWLSRKGSRLVQGFYKRFFGSWLGNHEEWLEKHIKKVIVISRFLVQLRFLGPFLAGQAKTPFKTFVLYDLLAIIVYVCLYVSVGWYFKDRIDLIASGVDIARNIILLLLVAGIAFGITKSIRSFFFNKFLGGEIKKP